MNYMKSQTGWILLGLFVPILVFLLFAYLTQWGDRPIPTILFLLLTGLLIFITLLFYKLTIEIVGTTIQIIYGIGLIRIKLILDVLHKVEVITTPWYYGLGIRITPKGMLYNIQGFKAVKLEYQHKGKNISVMIGTPEPERLKESLEKIFSNN